MCVISFVANNVAVWCNKKDLFLQKKYQSATNPSITYQNHNWVKKNCIFGFQILASAIANVLAYLIGIAVGSSSVVIARLSDGESEEDGGLKITDEEGSWIGIMFN